MEKFRHGGNIYKEPAPKGTWLDFSANINPLGLSDRVRQCILEHIDDVVHYPDPDAKALKTGIASHYGLPLEEIVLGNGASELLYLFFGMMRFSHVLLPQPAFSDYERAAVAAGSRVEYFFTGPEDEFRVSWEGLLARIPSVDCIVFGNPNNPTGTLLLAAELEECLETIPVSTWVLVDESFLDFREDEKRYTVRHLVERYPNLFVLRSLTKFYALPGLRIGFAAADPGIVKRMEAAKDVWNVNVLAQKAGATALSDEAYRRDTLRWLAEERAYMTEALQGIHGMRIFPPSVNFVLADVRNTGKAASYILSCMKRKGILLRDCSNYPSLDANYLRMAIRGHEENQKLMDAWKEIVGR